jgi:eukaryotic-like serine/threonine-protein kinase
VSSDRPVTTAREPARVPSARAGSPSVPGARLAGFEIVAELGRGALSTVYRVQRPRPSLPTSDPTNPDIAASGAWPTQYALKILDRSLADSAEALIAFRREAALLASVNHPGLTRVHEVGVAEGRPYLVMDLVDGVPLSEVMAAGPMPAERVIALALDIVDPLAAVHRKGLVHRDLKPPNVMVLAAGEARLIDFGLTARGGGSEPSSTVGTLAYAAPEQSGMLKRPVDNRSDLYSLGVILFEALAGQLPFPTDDVGELLRMHAVATAPDLSQLVPGTPRELADVVATLLAKDPDDRYQTGEALAADLRLLAGAAEETARTGVQLQLAGADLDRSPALPMTGRTRELTLLTERWTLAQRGHGGVCVVRGAGGAGKSRLTAELAELAKTAGSTVLHGKTSADDPVPFGPLRAAVEDHLQALGRMAVKERWRQRARIRAACAGWSASMLSRLAPGLEAILNGRDNLPAGNAANQVLIQDDAKGRAPGTSNVPDAAPGVTSPEAADGQNQFAAAVAGFLSGLARECGDLMLVLDDVQWLDAGSRRVLAHLSADLGSTALLVVVTARDDERSAVGTDVVVASMGVAVDVDLTLGPLDETGVADQIRLMMPGLSVDSRLVTLLHVRSNGNPFIVQEYLRAVVDAGLLRPSWGNWLLDEEGLDALELPQDAVGLVLTRVQGLGDEVHDLLVTAAAVGSRFRAGPLAAVHDADLEVVLGALVEAAGRGLIEPREHGEFAFLHDRIREALLAELSTEATAGLHYRIAQALDAMPIPDGRRRAEHVYAVAYHYMHCDPDIAAERAFATCWTAGRLALENHAPSEAVGFLEYAAELGVRHPSGFLLLLGTAFKQAGRLIEAKERLEQALLVESTLLRRAEIFTLLADVYRSNWNTDAALEAIDRGLSELGTPMPRSRVVLVFTTLVLFVAAMFKQWTGIGFGSATGLRREHCQAIATLHEVGAYVGVIGMRPDLVFVHTLRVLYWANQLGPGRRYALSQGSFGLICGRVGLAGMARRSFARADADPASEAPSMRASTAHYRGAALYLGERDNGQQWAQDTDAHGAWLDVATYLDAVSIFNLNACMQGRTRDAEYWLAQGQRRLGVRGGDVTSFISAAPMTFALLGRSGEAGAELRRMNELCAGHTARSLAVVRLLTTVFVLVEQGELGLPFEQAVAEFEALKPNPRWMMRAHRTIHFEIALARLTQLRSADEADRPVRLLAARRAVQLTTKGARTDELKTFARLARADLLVLEHESQRALKLLAEIPLFHTPDAPTLSFELARIRARALSGLGSEEARRQARLASSIALDQGWQHRAASVAAEFGLAPAERGMSSKPVSLAGAYAGGVERQRLQALQQVSAAASKVLDPGELARIALDETIRILAADRAFLFLTDASDGLVSHLGRDSAGHDIEELTGYSTSLVERVRATGEPLVVTGTEEGAALGAQSVVLHGLRSILVAPLQLEGRVLGVVYLDSQVAKGIFTADDAGILTALTNHIATSLETARAAQLEISVQTAQRQRDLADTLRQTLQAMAETLDPYEVIKRLLEATKQVVDCDDAWLLSLDDGHCSLLAADDHNGALVQQAVCDDAVLLALLAVQEPLVGVLVPTGLIERLGTATSWIAMPLRSRSANLGVLVLVSHRVEVDLGKAIEVAAALAAQGMTAYDKASLFKQVQELAVADELTGIANRRRFFEVASRDLAAASRHGRHLTALMVDIDHFKRVNDTHGHATGDDVIRTVAARLGAQVRQTDILGRYGGEEFALLLQDAGPGIDLPERLRACIADESINTRSGPVDVTVSVGLAYLTSQDVDIETFLARADQALYRAKREGRNRVCTAEGVAPQSPGL